MTFKESVISVYVKNYANFQGKASRSELWWAALFYLIVSLVVGVLVGIIVGMNNAMLSEEDLMNRINEISNYISTFLLIVILLPITAVNTRRFHDVGKSTKEALTIYAVALLSMLFIPIYAGGAIIQTNELFTYVMGFVCLISNAYLLYIYVKKPLLT